MAELLGVSRQNMRKLMVTHPLSFPAPLHEGSAAIWHLTVLLEWLITRAGYLAYDGIDGTTLQRTFQCVRRFGTVASIGQAGGQIRPLDIDQLGPAAGTGARAP